MSTSKKRQSENGNTAPPRDRGDAWAAHTSNDHEQIVLGSILARGWDAWRECQCLEEVDFALQSHRKLWKYMRKLANAEIEPTLANVYLQLMENIQRARLKGEEGKGLADFGYPDIVGDDAYWLSMGNLQRWCIAIRRHRIDREGIRLADLIAIAAEEGISENSGEISNLQKELEALERNLALGLKPATAADIIDRIGGMDTLISRPKGAIPMPIGKMNRDMNGGLLPGSLTVIAARPSVGKSALALQITLQAVRAGKRARFWSLEMPDEDLMKRLIAGAGQVPYFRLMEGNLNLMERTYFRDAVEAINGMPLELFTTEFGLTQILARLANSPCELAVIDYLGLIEAPGRFENRAAAVAHMSRSLKKAAMREKIPIVVLHQLNRDTEKDNRRPFLHDLRESGSIEQDADNVIFIYEPDKRSATRDRTKFEIILAKQRNGPRDQNYHVKFDANKMQFGEPDE